MPKSTPKTRALSVRALAEAEIRQESFMGRDFTVVPVIALVEGVLQGMNAKTPELATQEEFGRVPDGWNGRPVVMNHPVVDNKAVSANSPAVLESYQMGFLFNTTVAEGKLKTEAWLDNERIKTLAGEFQSTLDRINDGQEVEVSTGLFVEVEESKGRFNGKDYGGVWHNIVPDHLALLSEGTIGACSIDDGCGTPRNNQATLAVSSTAISWQQMDCGCKHGDKAPMPENNTAPTPDGAITIKPNSKGETPEFDINRVPFLVNGKPADMVDVDARKLVAEALRAAKGRGNYTYILGLTDTKVIYETWDYNGDSYSTFQQGYDISDAKAVTLGNDEERVVVTMSVTPVVNTAPKTNSTQTGDTNMPDVNTPAVVPVAPVTPVSANADTTTAAPTTTMAANAAPTPTPVATPAVQAQPRTLENYLGDMPADLRAHLQEGLALRTEKRKAIIAALKSTNRCTFNDEQLNGMSMEVLQSLADLASVPRYDAVNPGPTEVSDNSSNGFAPEAPKLIPEKKTA